MISEAVDAVEPLGGAERTGQRLFRALIDPRACAAEFSGVERVARGLAHGNVAGHSGYGDNAGCGGPQRHDQSNGIVGRGIRVDQDRLRHASKITSAVPRLPEVTSVMMSSGLLRATADA